MRVLELSYDPFSDCVQKEGLKPEGAVGEIKMLKLESKKYPGELWTANRPVFVQFMVSTTNCIFCLIHSNSTEAREGQERRPSLPCHPPHTSAQCVPRGVVIQPLGLVFSPMSCGWMAVRGLAALPSY